MYMDTKLGYEREISDVRIEKEMHNMKRIALRKLSSIAAHFNLQIANILAYSWFNCLPDAVKIAEQFDLSKMDLLAIQEDLEGFTEEFMRDREENQDFSDSK